MRPVFLWSEWGSLTFLAHLLKRAGVPATLYIDQEKARMHGAGYVPKTTNPVPPKGSLVIFDSVGKGHVGEQLRKQGHLVIGGNPFDRTLEANRWTGIQAMREAGITTPLTQRFHNISTAKRFLEDAEGDWFVKVSGAKASENSTCNADRETLIRYLTYVGKLPGEKSFILQQRVDGVEVSTNGWFDGVRFVPPFEGTFEEKKLLAGDLGPRTGCEQCVVWYHDSASTLPRETVLKLENQLRAARYVGPIDLNAIIAKDGTVYGLEWTARLGFDSTQAWVKFFEPKRLVEQLEEFAAGGLLQWELAHPKDYAVTVRVTVPPYPEGEPNELKKMSGWPVDRAILREPWCPEDVMAGDGGPVVAGCSGLVGVASASGSDFKALSKEVLESAEALKLPSKQYRMDILKRAPGDWATMATLGYA